MHGASTQALSAVADKQAGRQAVQSGTSGGPAAQRNATQRNASRLVTLTMGSKALVRSRRTKERTKDSAGREEERQTDPRPRRPRPRSDCHSAVVRESSQQVQACTGVKVRAVRFGLEYGVWSETIGCHSQTRSKQESKKAKTTRRCSRSRREGGREWAVVEEKERERESESEKRVEWRWRWVVVMMMVVVGGGGVGGGHWVGRPGWMLHASLLRRRWCRTQGRSGHST